MKTYWEKFLEHSVSGSNKVSGLRAGLIYCIAGLFLGYEMALQVLPGVISSYLTSSTNITMTIMGWIAGVYFISYTFMQIPGGIAYDFFNSRTVITLASLLCSLGVFLFSQTWSLFFLMMGRFITGFASAFAFTGVLVVSDQFFDKKWYPYLVSGAQFLGAFGAWAGEAPLSMMVQQLGLYPTEKILMLIGAALGLLAWLIIPTMNDSQEKQLDQFKKQIKETLHSKQTAYNALYAFFCWAPVIILGGAWGVPFLEKSMNLSTTSAATLVGYIWLAASIYSPILGVIANRVRSCTVPMTIMALVGCMASISFITYPEFLTAPMLVLIGASSAAQLLTFVLVKINNDSSVVGTALGLNNMAVVAGGIVFHPVIGYLMDLQTHFGQKATTMIHYQQAFIILPLCFIIAAVMTMFLVKDHDPC
ncbi:MAG: hypothetical protein CMF42_05105 [Legionellales bacterium]|nr:hypothetical protein [Legionellales bacterium]OUX67059.1 MAG: hypothetical protein CBD38_03450 [bacterium TMED178]|tara:strand:- start:1683 stop:2942 length:1260 start_codon:yes stop_codon:yes gene_type:complete